MSERVIYFALLYLCSLACTVVGDTPANCTYESIRGPWTFHIGPGGNTNTLQCNGTFTPVSAYDVTLGFPDVAYDSFGNKGYWTLIYNQGFEVVINNKKFFAFSMYKNDSSVITSICNLTFTGWAHDTNEKNWACYRGTKQQPAGIPPTFSKITDFANSQRKYLHNSDYIKSINSAQTSWTATSYSQYDGMTSQDLHRRGGGKRSARAFPRTARPTIRQQQDVKLLPHSFDWRDVNGENYVSPVRNQLSCGSCYAFGSMAMLEARTRVMTNNTVQKVFSTQDVVSCSEYSQGCEGGFPYLIAGKYGEDFGVIEESCFPYTAKDDPCKKTTCERYYTSDYYYVGGFYGACNEPLMRMELVKNGPIAISFEVYADFMNYKGGIYHHTGLEDHFNPWEITNHVVLVVGYGADPTTGEKFWSVKNSWSAKWGEEGYFRIRRATDECSMESMAVGVMPVV